MTVQSISWAPLAPVLVLVGGVVIVLLADLMLSLQVRRTVLPAMSAVACLGAAGSATWLRGPTESGGTFCSPAGSAQGVRCSYVLGESAAFLTVLLCLAAAAVLVLALAQLRADAVGRTPSGEYCLVLLAATIGAVIVAGSRDLITLVVGLETLTVPMYAAVAFRRGSTAGAEAALTLLVVSVTSTALMLLGIGFLYGLTGTMHLDALAETLTAGGGVSDRALSGVAVVLLLAGLAFKVGAVPFHVWAPSTYQGAPIPVAAYLSSVSKAGGIAGLIAVLPAVSAGSSAAATWIGLLAAVSMTVGNLVAMRQRHLVRLLAWSGIGQTGYLLVGLAVFSGRSEQALSGAGATLAYLSVYVLMTVGAFACIAAIADRTDDGEGPSVESVRGLAADHPRVAVAFALFLIGLAGLPPMAGFFAKVTLLQAAIEVESYTIVIVALVVSLLVLVAIARVWNEAFWKNPPDDIAGLVGRPGALQVSGARLIPLLLPVVTLASLTLIMGIAAEAILAIAMDAGEQLMNPSGYIQAVLGGQQ